jgi:histone-lysine N-methyltransferase SETMAR
LVEASTKKYEIRAYIKALSKLGCSLKQLMIELSSAYGPSCVSYDTVRRWKKNLSLLLSASKMHQSGRPKSASRNKIVSKIKDIIEGDARLTVRDIVRKVSISLSTVHFILKKHLKVRKISARWVPHLLTDEQKSQRVKVAKKQLQMFPKYDKKQFANVVAGDETWVYYFEPVRKDSNKIWATKHNKRPIIAKRSLSAKKILYAIFFSGEGVAIKLRVKMAKVSLGSTTNT